MQKLKKALKKLASLRSPKPAQAAKKSAPVKKKSQPIKAAKKVLAPAKKAPAKVAAKAPVKAPKVAAKPAAKAEVPAKDLKKKAPEAVKAPAPAAKKAAEKVEKAAVKKTAAQATPSPSGKKEKAAKVAAPDEQVKPEAAKKEAKAKKQIEEAAPVADEEVILTDAEGRRYCRVKDCDQISAVDSYCRYHYLLFWKNIQNRKKILSEGKLERYIEELTARYPDKYLEMLRKDLRSEKEFTAAIQELEIDESSVDSEYEDEAQSYLEEVRGMGGGAEAPARDDDDF